MVHILILRKTNKSEQEFKRNRREFNSYIEGGVDADASLITDENLRKVAVKSKQSIDRVGIQLVNAGLLPRSKFEENRGSYLPKLYMKHILDNPVDRN